MVFQPVYLIPVVAKISPLKKNLMKELIISVYRSLLKGESLQHEGNLILLGDVLDSSSLSVKGNLIVWGTVSGKISVESEQTDVFIKFIKFDDGEISMNDKPVEIAGKQQKNLAFEINLIDDEIQVHSNRSGGFNLL